MQDVVEVMGYESSKLVLFRKLLAVCGASNPFQRHVDEQHTIFGKGRSTAQKKKKDSLQAN